MHFTCASIAEANSHAGLTQQVTIPGTYEPEANNPDAGMLDDTLG